MEEEKQTVDLNPERTLQSLRIASVRSPVGGEVSNTSPSKLRLTSRLGHAHRGPALNGPHNCVLILVALSSGPSPTLACLNKSAAHGDPITHVRRRPGTIVACFTMRMNGFKARFMTAN